MKRILLLLIVCPRVFDLLLLMFDLLLLLLDCVDENDVQAVVLDAFNFTAGVVSN